MIRAVTLETDRLMLKALSREHCSSSYVKWMNDHDVIKYLETGGDYTLKKLNDFLLEQETNNILFWAIHIKKSNKHIGNIKIDPINYDDNSAEYGILMGDKKFWGKGFGYEASKRVLKY